MSSVLLFKEFELLKFLKINNFSDKHRSQYFPPFLYSFARDRIVQVRSGFGPRFSSQMCLERVVAYLSVSVLKDALWLAILVLKCWVDPM